MFRALAVISITFVAILGIVESGWFDSAGGSTKAVEGQASAPEQGRPRSEASDTSGLPIGRALGQMVVARFDGPNPSRRFLARIKRGQIGGVILFTENLRGGAGEISNRIRRLQDAAESQGNPPLLTMVDQEGGTVKRLSGPPQSSAAGMNGDDVRNEGEATGDLLAKLGFDIDLAPVADVGRADSFLGSRSFSSDPSQAANLACEFAAGLRARGVGATLKHFPGLGLGSLNTDETTVTVTAPAARLRRDYAPYRKCSDEPRTLVMVDSAVYPTLTGSRPAVMAPSIYRRELPGAGFLGVTISDDLETPAIRGQTTPARRSIDAGLDLLLYAGSEAASADAYGRLLEDVRDGAIPRRTVQSAAAKILALKGELSG